MILGAMAVHTRSKRYLRRQRARMRAAKRRAASNPPTFPGYENRLALQVAAGIKKRSLESRSCDVNPLSSSGVIDSDPVRKMQGNCPTGSHFSLAIRYIFSSPELWLCHTCLLTNREQFLLPAWNAGTLKWIRNLAHQNG